MKGFLIFMAALAVPALAQAEIVAGQISYSDNGVALEGYVAQPGEIEGKRPGVLVVHDWMGLNDHYRNIANRLAEMGYVVFAADIYGSGIRPKNSQEAAAEASKYKSNRSLMRERARVGLDELKKQNNVDENRLAAIGYCFGGTVALELARSGVPLAGVSSFHGGLETPNPEDGKNIKAKILALHGADDPFVPPAQVAAFQDEMRKGKVDWQMIYYGNAVHSFTTPYAGSDPSKGVAYNEKADRRSWQAMKNFFDEIFQTQAAGR
ncbi:MAG: dienelactone hydrolase family protein [Desulfomonile tiedjei]|uniref:Dienelactone hydrolase family protein n=1 Tax=Desulfomonile tiedjei TaxID=2358 RepID=A0A9D6Z4J0_9BACT|nr:dienelactone hydrolase family protein [Desulfomonile tiedjei]